MRIQDAFLGIWIFGTLFSWYFLFRYRIKKKITFGILAIPFGWIGVFLFIMHIIAVYENYKK